MRTALVAASAAGTLLAAGCGASAAPTSAPPPSVSKAPASKAPASAPPPVSGDGLILRTSTTGGIAGLGGAGSRPDLSLYADGRAIAGPSLTEYHLTPQALRRLIDGASKAGFATPHTVDNPQIADATYTVVTFVTGGHTRVSKIIQGGDRSGFLQRLNPATWPRSDMTAAPAPYRPAKAAVLAVATAGAGRRWPLPSLTGRVQVGTGGCTVYAGADAAKAARLPAGALWRDHARTYRITVRPLLPDESGCADLK
jgi:hypothetical protein